MVVLGIDLATRHIGLVILSQGHLIYRYTLELAQFDVQLKQNVEKIKSLIEVLMRHYLLDLAVIELANFKSAALSQKFAFYAGIIYSLLNCEVKYCNSNEWQRKLGCMPNDTRAHRKAAARAFVEGKGFNTAKWTEDEIDAFCIAWYAPELYSSYERHKHVLKRRQIKNRALAKQRAHRAAKNH